MSESDLQPDSIAELLKSVIDAKPGGAQRDGQIEMAIAVSQALSEGTHLLCEAGPGTGKSFGYLIPVVASQKKVVISTATKSLQDQLAERDLPFLAETLKPLGMDFSWATVKGRQSYLCLSKLAEHEDQPGQSDLFGDDQAELVGLLTEWAEVHDTGDRDDLPLPVGDDVWTEFSVSGMECPGRDQCPQGGGCFAMAALERANRADIVIVNHHLYGADLAMGGSILPEHDLAVFDEAHRLEDTMASALGIELNAGRLWQYHKAASAYLRRIMPSGDLRTTLDPLRRLAGALEEALLATGPGMFDGLQETDVGGTLTATASLVTAINGRMRSTEPATQGLLGTRARALRLGGHLAGDMHMGLDPPQSHVSWIESEGTRPNMKLAPINVGPLLAEKLLSERPTVLTSATMSVGGSLVPLASRLGYESDPAAEPLGARMLAVGSPFDFEVQGRIYVAAALPDPRQEGWQAAALDEICELVEASGGRALVLTTSYRMLEAAAARLNAESEFEILIQGQHPKRQLVERFEQDETSVLVATMGFWEGLDIPGRSLELVIIDRLPFPRPDDPLWVARRREAEASGRSSFQTVDLPRATMLLAQGVGRLIRTTEDRGVVALLDSRLARMRYGRVILGSLPPMPISGDKEEAVLFLQRP